MEQKDQFYYGSMQSPIGPLTLVVSKKGLCKLKFGSKDHNLPSIKAWMLKQSLKHELIENDKKIEIVRTQLNEYFQRKRKQFDLDLDLYGTRFQKKVWEHLLTVDYGSTISYKQLASLIGAPKAVRAVGGANNKNPIPIIIPCHRVIGTNGALVGYRGGLDIKKSLLKIEQSRLEQLTS